MLSGRRDKLADILSPEQRSVRMALISSKDTKPELRVRQRLFEAGFRYRLHVQGLPGHPDIVMRKYATAIFVNGCFWHRHECKLGQRLPSSNRDYWAPKLARNKERDRENYVRLRSIGWNVEIVWACQVVQDTDRILRKLGTSRTVLL